MAKPARRNTSKARAKRAAARAREHGPSIAERWLLLWPRLLIMLRVTAAVAVFALSAAAVLRGIGWSRERSQQAWAEGQLNGWSLTGNAEQRPVGTLVHFVGLPYDQERRAAWMPSANAIAMQVERIAEARKGSGPLAREPLDAIAALFDPTGFHGATPLPHQRDLGPTHAGWIDGDLRVWRSATGTISVSARWRTPFACVRVEDATGSHLIRVSAAGHPLPFTDAPDAAGLPWLTGVHTPAGSWPLEDRHYDAPWPSQDVIAPLALLRFLDRPFRSDPEGPHVLSLVDGIGVRRVGDATELTLHTRSGGRLVWGAFPHRSERAEVSDDRKLAHLEDRWMNAHTIDFGAEGLFDISGAMVRFRPR